MTPEGYEDQVRALLPPGPAWPQGPDDPPMQLGSGWAYSVARMDAVIIGLVDEADPTTTYALLDDWERVAGLPDACELAFGGEQEIAQRRSALLARITSAGGQTAAYYISVAAAMGYDITITEFSEHTVDDDVDAEMNGQDWAFAWAVNATTTTVTEFSVDDTADDPLAWWGNAILECVFERIKPAHTTLIFSYS